MVKNNLEEYEELCPECDGTGFWKSDDTLYDFHTKAIKFKCSKCGGSGKIDWLDKLYNREKCGIKIWGQKTLELTNHFSHIIPKEEILKALGLEYVQD